MPSGTKDEVDRLFECFKCGISPPQSAVRERKRNKEKMKQEGLTQVGSAHSSLLSPGLKKQKQQNAKDVQLCTEKFGSTTVKSSNFSRGKQISPVVFYGSPHGVPPKRPSSLLRLLREIHVDLTQENKLSLRRDVWATFPRQNEAMKFAKGHPDVYVFSYQDHLNGQRRFLVSTYTEFWRRYKNMSSKYRHHYEVIQEGLPCHLYFDLEFNKKDNAERNGDEMVDLLISVIFEALLEKYSIQADEEWIVELDSSTEEKFSRHLIIRIPKIAFKDNSHAGAFVAEICSRILSGRERDGRFKKLLVSKDSSSPEPSHLFVDTAVYSRNRCFRLALSSKAGKRAVLLPTGRFKCKDMSEEDLFMASLICNMDASCEKLLVCKMDLECVKTLHFDTEVNCNLREYSCASREYTLNACTSDVSTAYMVGKSPFPALDVFIESVASIANVSGKIRSWYWFSEHGLMVYSMSRNRYCERIGRQHKSNHVMYVVDLRRGDYYQKCYDPDCKGYRSPLRPIPMDVVPDTTIFFNSDGDGGATNSNFEYQFVDNNQEHIMSYGNESIIGKSCKKDGWWLEVLRVADNVENLQKTLDLSNTKKSGDGVDDYDDDDWWVEVERTASQVEVTYSQLN